MLIAPGSFASGGCLVGIFNGREPWRQMVKACMSNVATATSPDIGPSARLLDGKFEFIGPGANGLVPSPPLFGAVLKVMPSPKIGVEAGRPTAFSESKKSPDFEKKERCF